MRFSKMQCLDQALGLSQEHLVEVSHRGYTFSLHCEVADHFLSLADELDQQDFQLSVVSSYRSFERQLAIFSAKAKGRRPVLDGKGKPLDITLLSDEQLLFAILRWSALPGLSRHHFGSDLDVFDSANQRRENVELLPSEVEGQGPSANLHKALDSLISHDASRGFFRPYQVDVGGIAPERWHLSYACVSSIYEGVQQEASSLDYLLDVWRRHDLPLFDTVLNNIEHIFKRYVQVSASNQPPWLE
ncbi:MAG: M15 family metallopeptidase [Sinobacterium sp.]|nr:M15 family metallopeptidase [Sinobacterium sp.]